MIKKTTILLMLFLAWNSIWAQDELLDLFETTAEPTRSFTYATFKTSRVVYGQSIENPATGNLLFLIQHNFGSLNSGAYELFGLDRATIRIGLEYGINDFLSVGFGRSSWEKTYDGFIKAKLLRQSTGQRNMPVTVSYMGSITVNTLKWAVPDRKNYFSSRLAYINQLLIARKFSNMFSLQLSPTLIHKNFVPTREDKNTSFALGIGGRYKLSQRLSLNAEYFYYPSDQTTLQRTDAVSIGFDIETGGHVFQLHISNAQAMFDRAYITETTGSWGKGDIFFGFNIARTFVLKKPKAFR
jgi:opacity protein-like surface antigen